MSQALRGANSLLVKGTANGARNNSFAEAENLLSKTFDREKKTLNTILNFNNEKDTSDAVDSAVGEIERQYQSHLTMIRSNAKRMGYAKAKFSYTRDNRVPVRTTRGPLDFGLPESKLVGSDLAWYGLPGNRLSGSAKFELVNFIDGNRDASEIRDALSAEFGPVKQEVISRYLADMVKVGVMGWK